MNAIAKLMRPRSVAIIGASTDPSKTAGKPAAFLQKHGFAGDIWPVNPRADRIGNLPCYADIAALPGAPDVAIVLLNAQRSIEAVRELSPRGSTAAIILASGFSETGAIGAARQTALKEAAGSMRLLGPNTIGLVNLTDRIVLSASGALDMDDFPQGRIAFVSQSGGILGAFLSRCAARGAGMSKLVATSNEADLEICDFLDHLADDEHTSVIALYLEGIRNPPRFIESAARARSAGKHLVAFKTGRSEAGARAAASHTGAMAGEDRMYDALFDACGVTRAQTFSSLIDISAALASGRKLKGPRIAILTSTGGAGTLIADSLGLAGLVTPPPGEATAARLRALQTGEEAVLDQNPIDVTLAGLHPTVLGGVANAVLESDDYDALTVIVGSSGIANPGLMANALRVPMEQSTKPVIAYLSPHAPDAARLLTQNGVPAFTESESCAAALGALLHASQTQTKARGNTVRRVAQNPSGALDEHDSKQLFARYGIHAAPEFVVTNAVEAKAAAQTIGGTLALKILSREILHKSDAGGVALNLDTDRIGSTLDTMRQTVQEKTGIEPQRFLVQQMLPRGVEIILGARRDHLGMAILVGLGGVASEIYKDTSLRLLADNRALTADDALAMLKDLKCFPLLQGWRGAAACDIAALCDAICAFSRMALEHRGALLEAEINPLFVFAQGQGVAAADGLAVFEI